MSINNKKIFETKGLRCAYCGFTIDPELSTKDDCYATIDHVQPKAKGGSDAASNLVPSCRLCNHVKDDMTLAEFRTAIITGHVEKDGKDKELATLKTPRYMIPYGKYTGVANYMWGGKFYFEKKGKDKEINERIADAVQAFWTKGGHPDGIDNLLKKPHKNISIVINNANSERKNMPKTEQNQALSGALPDAGYELKGAKSITKSEKKMLYKHFKYRCCYCGCALRADDQILGHGNAMPSKLDIEKNYTTDNTVSACQDCQSVKKDMPLEIFRQIMLIYHGDSCSVDNKTRKRIASLFETHYTGILCYNGNATEKNRFYFELEDVQKENVKKMWDSQPMTDSYGLITGEAISPSDLPERMLSCENSFQTDLVEKSEDMKEKLEDPITDIMDDATKKLQKEYEKLQAMQKELTAERDRIDFELKTLENKMAKVKDVIRAMSELIA